MQTYLLDSMLYHYSEPNHNYKGFLKFLIIVLLAFVSPGLFAQDRTVTGTVLSKLDNQPLPGVTVSVKGKPIYSTTNDEGKFSIKTVDPNDILVFTSVDHLLQEVTVNKRTSLQVLLATDAKNLNEVVVTGYNTQKKKEYTGSAVRISAQAVADRPVPSFDQALAGQAAGVSITSNGGALNAAPVFRIRGINSIQLSSYPLIIIDGVTVFTGDVGNTAQNNPLADLNPNDIESIDILKDASATAIYGSRAANGVVVISTKKGKQGKAKVNYDAWVGINTKPKLPAVLNAADYVMIKNESLKNSGQFNNTPNDNIADVYYALQNGPDGNPINTNWYDYVYQTGKSHNHNLSISGASETTSYFVSLGYSDQEGFMVKNTFDRKSIRLNLEHKLTKKLTIGTNMTYSNSMNANLTSGINASFSLNNLARMAMVLPPNLSPLNSDGTYNMVGNSIGPGAGTITTGYYNPLPLIEHDQYTSESNTFLGGAYLEFELMKHLKFKSNYSLNNINVENRSFSNPYQAGGFANNGSATNAINKNHRTDWTNTLNYVTTIRDKHSVNLLAGTQDIHTTTNGWGVTRQSLNDRFFETFEGGWAQLTGSTGTLGENGFRSYFTNANYAYDSRYLFSLSYRRDGFSGLSSQNKFGNFGGGSVGWNVSEEGFFQRSAISNIFSALKVRGSYGQVGNVNIGNFPSLSLYSSGIYAGIPTLIPSQTGNEDLQWETSKKTDIGVNIGLFDNRITIDADYYKNDIDGMILDVPQAPSKGIPGNTITSNVGSMYNKGFEFAIHAQVISKKDFRWSADLNLSLVKNRVTELANNNADIWTAGLETSNIIRVGESVGTIYVVKTTGVNPANGLRIYTNRKGEEVQYNPVGSRWTYLDGTTASPMDAYLDGYVFGDAIPKYYGGFNNNFSYKNFDVYVSIVYSGGNKMYNGTRATLLDNRFFNNQTDILRRWTKPGDITDIPKLVYNDQYASGSVLMHSANVEDGSYVKLRNVSLGYKVPSKLFAPTGISAIRFYASASNFILHTKYTGSDPEISANGDSNSASGRDKNSVPAGRSFTLGLNLAF